MKQRKFFYNASGLAVDEKGNFVSIKAESTEILNHRKKLLSADVWRNRKVRPAEIMSEKRSPEQIPEIEKALAKCLKALDRVNAEVKSRKPSVIKEEKPNAKEEEKGLKKATEMAVTEINFMREED